MITAMRTGEPHRTGLEPPLSKVSDWQLATNFASVDSLHCPSSTQGDTADVDQDCSRDFKTHQDGDIPFVP
jgi:hypothetical protein